MRQTILYDHQIFDEQEYGGISRYFFELIRGLPDERLNSEIAFLHTKNRYLLADPHFSRVVRRFPTRTLPFRITRKLLKELRVVPDYWALDREKRAGAHDVERYSIFHPTYYDPGFLPLLRNRPFVLTVHDMIHERFPTMFAPEDPVPRWKQQLVAKAALVLANSHSTKRDIVEILKVDPDRIIVTHFGNSLAGWPSSTRVSRGLPKNYLLFVGKRRGYKNFTRMIEAIAGLLQRERDLFLVSVGGEQLAGEERAQLVDLGIRGQVRFIRVEEREMFSVYHGARMLILPSLYEGFGLPILEAFAAGSPVVLGNVSSLPEVAGRGALYFDPADPESISDSVQKVLYDSTMREDLIRLGQERLQQFSWDRTVQETKNAYRSILP